ncbi:hypothetical protein [Streptomyces sp. CBG30]|uniref:vWA-MoxR associated conflict system protein n=1 Tax=Streptomyces sp. CBG30 TaxID=2838869 RepID=UPI0035AFCC94
MPRDRCHAGRAPDRGRGEGRTHPALRRHRRRGRSGGARDAPVLRAGRRVAGGHRRGRARRVRGRPAHRRAAGPDRGPGRRTVRVRQRPVRRGGLWLARNVRPAPGAAGGVVGPLGLQDLAEAVTMWRRDGIRLPAPLTLSDLGELDAFAREGKVDGSADPRWHGRVRQVVATLLRCAGTVDLLTTVLASVLTSELLREARRLSGLPAEAEGAELLRGLVEYAALRAPGADEPPWKASARFLAALSQVSGSDEVAARLRAWARDLGAVTEFNDALAEFARRRQEGELRLVVSLAGALTDWPEEVDAWLVGTGEPLPVHRRFACASPDRAGTGRAIGTALAWARTLLPATATLVHVDIAAPAHLLARWRPEESKVGLRLLGVNHDVVVRWSGRMDPADESAEMNDAARKALRSMADCTTVPVEWLGAAVLGDHAALERGLSTGRYDTVVGLDHHPDALQDVLEQLLPYAPIILWPRQDARPSDEGLAGLVREHWQSLPHGLPAAYRNRWSEQHEGCVACLGDVRAIWHDEPWLEFCRPFEQRVVAGPEEEW